MHSDKAASLLRDIIENIERIEQYTDGMNPSTFRQDQLVLDAVERCFQWLTEASIQLGPLGNDYLPMQDRTALRKFGNFLRHHYNHVDADTLWELIELDLPSLKHDCHAALDAHFPSDD